MKVGRDRHPRVWFAAAPPGGLRVKPRRLLRAGPVRTPWNAKAGKAGGALDRRVFFLASALARHTPSFGGTGKETGRPQARPNLGPLKLCCLTIEYDASARGRRRPAAQCVTLYSALRCPISRKDLLIDEYGAGFQQIFI